MSLNRNDVLEIRFHGRGGQGAVTAANILVGVAYRNGLWGQAFPFFGAERRGAPVTAFARIGKGRIRVRSMIRNPDIVVVLDDGLVGIVDVTSGLKDGGKVLVNTQKDEVIRALRGDSKFSVYVVNATKIALDLGLVLAGWPLVNTAILGALAKILNFPFNTVEEAIIDYLGPEKGRKNVEAARRAYEEVRLIE